MKEKIRSISFVILIIFLAVFNIIKPDKTFSSKENRYLKEFPKIKWENIISGKFGKDFEEYSTDQFISRDSWISLKTISDLAIQKKDNTRVYFGKDDYLFDVDKEIDQDQLHKNIKDINAFLDKMKKYNKDIDIYALMVPTKSQVLVDKLPSYAPTIDESQIVDRLNDSLKDNINIINLIDNLKRKKDEYIYYKTDHHWTSKGAFYAYKYFLETKGEIPLLENQFTVENVSKEFLGSSYRKANYYSGSDDMIDIYNPKGEVEYNVIINKEDKKDSLYDESYLDKTDKYSYFLGGDTGLIEIETRVKNNKTILVIKDSFANSFIPFLTNHYEKLIAIDPRYFNMSITEYIEGEEVDEVIFLFNIKTFVQEKSLNILSK